MIANTLTAESPFSAPKTYSSYPLLFLENISTLVFLRCLVLLNVSPPVLRRRYGITTRKIFRSQNLLAFISYNSID